MDQETAQLLSSAGAGVLGALIGDAASLTGGYLQHRLQGRAEREREGRRAPGRLQGLCPALTATRRGGLPGASGHDEWGTSGERSSRISAAQEELEALVVDLPSPLQERIRERITFIRYADLMGADHPSGGTYYRGAVFIARRVAADAHEALAAFLRNESSLPGALRCHARIGHGV
jgi:hypothetical protein